MGALRFRGKFDNKCVTFIQFMFSSIVAVWSLFSMTTMFVLLGFASGSRFSQTRGLWSAHWLPWFFFSLKVMAKLKCSCLWTLFDTIVELHAVDEKLFSDLLIGKWELILCVIKAYLIQDSYFGICGEGVYHIKLNFFCINTWVHFLAHRKYIHICVSQ